MSEHWTDRLSEYMDGELSAQDRERLESHLTSCAACRGTLDSLRRVVAHAENLPDTPPARDLWAGIRQQIIAGDDVAVLPFRGHGHPPRRFSFSGWQLAAAATVLMLATGLAVWLLSAPHGAAPLAGAPAGGTESAASFAAQFVNTTEENYDGAIRELERELAARRPQLDSATVAVVEHNLQIIDGAIAEARQALRTDPSNTWLYRHLDDTLMRKIDLLRHAASLRSET